MTELWPRIAAEMVDLASQIAAHIQAYKVAVEERNTWRTTAQHEIEQTTLARLERDEMAAQVKAQETGIAANSTPIARQIEARLNATRELLGQCRAALRVEKTKAEFRLPMQSGRTQPQGDALELHPLMDPGTPGYIEEAWDIARTIAAIDKQLISSCAVEMIAQLAALAYQSGRKAVTHADDWQSNTITTAKETTL